MLNGRPALNVSKPQGGFFGVVSDYQPDEVNKFFAEESFTLVIHDE